MIPIPKPCLIQSPFWAIFVVFSALSLSELSYSQDLNSSLEVKTLRAEQLFKEAGYKIYTKQYEFKFPNKVLDGVYSNLETDKNIYWVESYLGYNIIKYKNVFYAIHRSEGLVTPEELRNFSKKRWITEWTIKAIKLKLKFLLAKSGQKALQNQGSYLGPENIIYKEERPGILELPILIHENYKGFNIIKYNDLYYAVNQAEGPINIYELEEKAKLPWVHGETLDEVLNKVDQIFSKMLWKRQLKYWVKSLLSF